MAALSQTAASVRPSALAIRHPSRGALAGATIAAGQPIFLDANGAWQLADADVALGASDATAVAGNSASTGQYVDPIIEDPAFIHGLSGVTAGDTIWTHSTAGSYTKTIADLIAGFFTTVVMVATAATTANLKIIRSGVAHA